MMSLAILAAATQPPVGHAQLGPALLYLVGVLAVLVVALLPRKTYTGPGFSEEEKQIFDMMEKRWDSYLDEQSGGRNA